MLPAFVCLSSPALPLSKCPISLYSSRVPAGFPSPADDHTEGPLDLNQLLIRRPAATFFVRAEGDSMEGAGIRTGDILVVDRSLNAADGRIVVAQVDGELTVKRLRRNGDKVWLHPESELYPPIEITAEMEAAVWGVVTAIVRQV